MGLFDFFKRKKTGDTAEKPQKKAKSIDEMSYMELLDEIDGIEDQNKLYEIVIRPQIIGTSEEAVIKKAMPKITDGELLEKMALNADRPYAASLAVKSWKISQESLAKVVKYAVSDSHKLEAARKLYTIPLIIDALISQSPIHDASVEYTPIVNTLISRLTDPADLKQVEEKAESRWVASCAAIAREKIPAPDEPRPDKDEQGRVIHWHYADQELAKITNQYIDQNGLNGLSKEETELARPFMVKLFSYYHNNAVDNDHSTVCMRKECDLKSRQPVFLTASRVLCVDCALQYIIGNTRDWYYYLDNLAPQIGAVPGNIQGEGRKVKEEIAALRDSKTDVMTDEELSAFILGDGGDRYTQAKAIRKIKDQAVLDRVAGETRVFQVMDSALDCNISRGALLKILNNVSKSSDQRAGAVRTKATLKLGEKDLEAVLDGKIPGAVYYAVSKITNREFLENYMNTTKYESNRELAKKRLEELDKG